MVVRSQRTTAAATTAESPSTFIESTTAATATALAASSGYCEQYGSGRCDSAALLLQDGLQFSKPRYHRQFVQLGVHLHPGGLMYEGRRVRLQGRGARQRTGQRILGASRRSVVVFRWSHGRYSEQYTPAANTTGTTAQHAHHHANLNTPGYATGRFGERVAFGEDSGILPWKIHFFTITYIQPLSLYVY